MSSKMTSKEVIFWYATWLSTRRRETLFGAFPLKHAWSPIADTLKEFEAFNPEWNPSALTFPVPTYFSPSSRFYEWEVKTIHLPWIRLKRWYDALD